MDGTEIVNRRSARQWRRYTPATPTHTQITDMRTSTCGTSKRLLLFVLLTGAGLMAGCNQPQNTDLQEDAATAGAESAEASPTEATETDDPYAAEGERRQDARPVEHEGLPWRQDFQFLGADRAVGLRRLAAAGRHLVVLGRGVA